MPRALTKEIPDTDEIEITIDFSAEDPIEQAFKKSLLDSFLPQNQDQYVKDGLSLACVDGFEKEGKVIVRGLANDINYRLHSPSLKIPEDISSDPSKLEHFWKDGDFQQKLTALTAEAASSSTQHMLSQLGGPVESEIIEETQKEEYPRPLAPEPPVDDEEYDSTETQRRKLS